MSSTGEDPNAKETNIEKEKNIPHLIDDFEEFEDKSNEKEKEKENENENENENEKENKMSNGLDEIENNEVKVKEKPKLKKYVPKNEQEALKARIINLEINEKPHEQNKDNFDFHMHDNLDTSVPGQIEKFKIPPELKKTFIIVMILAVLGVTLIICGFIKAISDATPGGGIMFWVLGTVVIIPGGFYSYQFYKAKKAKEEYRRQDILDNIPQL